MFSSIDGGRLIEHGDMSADAYDLLTILLSIKRAWFHVLLEQVLRRTGLRLVSFPAPRLACAAFEKKSLRYVRRGAASWVVR
jgi:hypothetical protein